MPSFCSIMLTNWRAEGMDCPVCNGKTVGKVGPAQFYCWNCFVEYQLQDDEMRIFSVAEDGSLIDYEPLAIS